MPRKIAICPGILEQPQITYRKGADTEQMKELVRREIMAHSGKPILVFLPETTRLWASLFFKQVRDEALILGYQEIWCDEDAKTARRNYRSQLEGLFVIANKYRRGFDLKLAADAVVIIFDHDGDVTSTEIHQGIGRSCRRQGLPRGIVILKVDKNRAHLPAADILAPRDEKADDEGP